MSDTTPYLDGIKELVTIKNVRKWVKKLRKWVKTEVDDVLNSKISIVFIWVWVSIFFYNVIKYELAKFEDLISDKQNRLEKFLNQEEIEKLKTNTPDVIDVILNLENRIETILSDIWIEKILAKKTATMIMKEIHEKWLLIQKSTSAVISSLFSLIYIYLYTITIRTIIKTYNNVSSRSFWWFSALNWWFAISNWITNYWSLWYLSAFVLWATTVIVNEIIRKEKWELEKWEEEKREKIKAMESLFIDFAQWDNPWFLCDLEWNSLGVKMIWNDKFEKLTWLDFENIKWLSMPELFKILFNNNPKEIKRAEEFIKWELKEEPIFNVNTKDWETIKMIWNRKDLKWSWVINVFLSYEEILKQRKVNQNNIAKNTPIISKSQARKDRKIAKEAREKEIAKNEKILAREMLKKWLEVNRISMILYDRVMKMKDPAVIYEKDNKDFLKWIPLFWNPAMEKITWYKFEEIKDKTQLEIMELLYWYDEVEFKRVLSYLSDMNSTGEGYDNTVFTLMTKKWRQILEEIKKLKSSEPNNLEKIEELERLIEYEKVQIAWHADRVETGWRISIWSLDQARIKETLRKDMNFNCLNSRALKEDYNNIITVHNQENITDISKAYVSVAFCDVDNFKWFNDTYWHDVWDLILAEIIRVVWKNLRKKEDNLYRIGWDEFVVMLSFADNYVMKQKLQTIIETLSRTTIIPIYDESKKIIRIDRIVHNSTEEALEYSKNTNWALPPIFTSWWISKTTFKEHKALDQVKKEADLALYEAKNSGKNQVIIYEPKL